MAQEDFYTSGMPDMIRQWRYYLALLGCKPGDHVLDVGCNKGDTERLLLRDYPTLGQLVGLDHSARSLAQAAARCAVEAQGGLLAFVQADACALPFAAASWDKVLCAETVEWIPEPLRALRELHRVLRPGGAALVVHTDFDTQVYHAADRQRSRRICLAFADGGPNGQIGRALYGLCRQAGFSCVQPSIYPVPNTALRPDLYGYRMALMMREWVREQGISDEDWSAWWDDLVEQDRRGAYFYSVNRYLCWCAK